MLKLAPPDLTYCETCGEGYTCGMSEVYIYLSDSIVSSTWACEWCARLFDIEEKMEATVQFMADRLDNTIKKENEHGC